MIKMKLGKKIVSIMLSCAVLAGVFLSPVAEVRSAAATYRGDVRWISNGREVYIATYGGDMLNLDEDHYLYGVDEKVSLTVAGSDIFDAKIDVYLDNQYNEGIPNGSSGTYSVDIGQALKACWQGLYRVYLYTGYPIIFKDKGDADFSGEMAPENSFYFWGDTSVSFAEPHRIGYTFKGWYSDAECTVPCEGWSGARVERNMNLTVYADWEKSENSEPSEAAAPHIHEWIQGKGSSASETTDGNEGTYCRICGYSLNSDPSLAFEYAINKNTEKLDKAVIGQNVVMEFGKWNSFSKEFMTMVKEKVAEGVSVTLKFWYNGVEYTITIPAYSLVDTSLDWYGPFCMYQIYELGIPVTKQ